ncbi:MAG: chromate transporter [Burkholderiaceae bacterium]
MSTSPPSASPESSLMIRPAPASCRALFWTFAWIGLSGFGGVLPWVRRELVEQKEWMTPAEFTELLSMGQLIPGPSVSNFTVMLGRRYFGLKGAIAAVLGLYFFPLCIILMLGYLYQSYGQQPLVQHILDGVKPVSAGLVIATSLKLVGGLPRSLHTALFVLLTFIAITLLHLPLVLTMLVLAPVAIGVAWKQA